MAKEVPKPIKDHKGNVIFTGTESEWQRWVQIRPKPEVDTLPKLLRKPAVAQSMLKKTAAARKVRRAT
jgi:hypothetical protein